MKIGAGIIVVSRTTHRILLTRRSDSKAWANFGGTMKDFETTYQCAVREMYEESAFTHGIDYKIVGTKPVHIKETPTLIYYSYIAGCDGEPTPILNHENIDFKWFELDNLPNDLHYGVSEVLTANKMERAIKRLIERSKQ